MAARLSRLTSALARLLSGGCLLCDQRVGTDCLPGLCALCAAALPYNHHACIRCALPLPQDHTPGQATCGACTSRAPPFTRTVAPLLYEGFPQQWVRRMKNRFGLVEGRLLGLLLARAVLAQCHGGSTSAMPPPDALIPVPLARLRLARRGHNQALTLALPVARRLGVPVSRMAVRRIRATPPQQGLNRARRLANLAGAFASTSWQGQRLAIVDDVMTTGATVTALATTLLNAGAGEVLVFCAARTAAKPRPG